MNNTSSVTPVLAPLINNNESTVTLLALSAPDRQPIKQDEVIGQVESTKSVMELVSPCDGYLVNLYPKGAEVPVGDPIFLILSDPQTDIESYLPDLAPKRMISKGAAQLLLDQGIDSGDIPGTGPLSEKSVKGFLGENQYEIGFDALPDNALLIYCAGKHAEVVYDLALADGRYSVVGFTDYKGKAKVETLFGVKVFNKFDLVNLLRAGVKQVHINTDNFEESKRVADIVEREGGQLASIIHPSAVISPMATLGKNLLVGANASIGTLAEIGDFSKVLNCSSVAHHAKIGQNSQISDGARIAGSVTLGDNCVIGLNASVNMTLTVCSDVIVPSGRNVYKNVSKKGMLVDE